MKKSHIHLWLRNKSNLLNFLPAQEPRRIIIKKTKKTNRSGFSTSAFTQQWAGLPCTTETQRVLEQLWTSQSVPTAWTEIHFAVPVWVGERGIHSFPPLKKKCGASQPPGPNRVGKIRQTKVMLHQISASQPRQVPLPGARTTCAYRGKKILQPT